MSGRCEDATHHVVQRAFLEHVGGRLRTRRCEEKNVGGISNMGRTESDDCQMY